jgi:hypothetical protein
VRTIRRGGRYARVADPRWENPLDGRYAQARGGRWNPPDSFPVVYLCASVGVARANVLRKLEGQPYGPEDLRPNAAPALVWTTVAEARYVDAITSRGCVSAGLPQTYPRDQAGAPIGWDACQPIGQAAWDGGAPGIACRSAAPQATAGGEELAWFMRGRSRLRRRGTESFDEWFWPSAPQP